MSAAVRIEVASTSIQVALAAPLPVGDFPDYYRFDAVEFVEAPVTPMAPSRLRWNADDGTLEVGMGFGGVVQQIGQEVYILVSNNNSHLIPNGAPVQFSGAGVGGEDIGVSLAKADGTVNPYRTLGLATMDIPVGEVGLVTARGRVRTLDTTGAAFGESWAVGDILYVHPTIPGQLTKVRPPVPAMTIALGAVARVGATDGVIAVEPRIVGRLVYIAAYSSAQQNIAAPNTAQAVTFPTVRASMGVTNVAGALTVDTAGFYSLDFSLGVRKTGGSQRKLYVWLRVGGVDVASTAQHTTISGSTAETTVNGHFAVALVAGQSVELMMAADSTEVYLDAEAATAFAPAGPSARVTLRQINA